MGIGSDQLFHGGGSAAMRTTWTSDTDKAFRQREQQRAKRVVAANATSADDCRGRWRCSV